MRQRRNIVEVVGHRKLAPNINFNRAQRVRATPMAEPLAESEAEETCVPAKDGLLSMAGLRKDKGDMSTLQRHERLERDRILTRTSCLTSVVSTLGTSLQD